MDDTPDNTAQDTAQPSQQDASQQAPSQQAPPGRLRTLANGAVYDYDKHKIVANPGGGTHAITRDNSGEFHKMRAQARLTGMLAYQEGMMRAARSDNLHGAVVAVAEKQTELAMDVKNHPNASVRAAELSLRAAGVLTDDRLDRLDVNINHNLPDFSAVRRLLAAVSGELDGEGQALDVEWTDLE